MLSTDTNETSKPTPILPNEIWGEIFKFLPGEALLNLAVACKFLHKLINKPEVLNHIKDILLITHVNRHIFYPDCIKLANGNLIYIDQDCAGFLFLLDNRKMKIIRSKYSCPPFEALKKSLLDEVYCKIAGKTYSLNSDTLELHPRNISWSSLPTDQDRDDITTKQFSISSTKMVASFTDKETNTTHDVKLITHLPLKNIRKLQPNTFVFFNKLVTSPFAVWNSETHTTRYYDPTIKTLPKMK
jgi:hypothetical protein